MKILIENNSLLIDGNDAGSVEDALLNFPNLSNELFAGLVVQVKELTANLSARDAEITQLKNQIPVAVDVSENPRLVTAENFRLRFTDAQLADIAIKSTKDVNLFVLLIKLFTAHTPIDLDSADIQAGLDYLVSIGVLTDKTEF